MKCADFSDKASVPSRKKAKTISGDTLKSLVKPPHRYVNLPNSDDRYKIPITICEYLNQHDCNGLRDFIYENCAIDFVLKRIPQSDGESEGTDFQLETLEGLSLIQKYLNFEMVSSPDRLTQVNGVVAHHEPKSGCAFISSNYSSSFTKVFDLQASRATTPTVLSSGASESSMVGDIREGRDPRDSNNSNNNNHYLKSQPVVSVTQKTPQSASHSSQSTTSSMKKKRPPVPTVDYDVFSYDKLLPSADSADTITIATVATAAVGDVNPSFSLPELLLDDDSAAPHSGLGSELMHPNQQSPLSPSPSSSSSSSSTDVSREQAQQQQLSECTTATTSNSTNSAISSPYPITDSVGLPTASTSTSTASVPPSLMLPQMMPTVGDNSSRYQPNADGSPSLGVCADLSKITLGTTMLIPTTPLKICETGKFIIHMNEERKITKIVLYYKQVRGQL